MKWTALLICTLALAGCEPSDVATRGTVAAPGSQSLGISQAVKYFGDVCVDNAPDFRTPPEELTSAVFWQNPTTGTYFHQTLNLSFKLVASRGGPACSMVFASTEDTEQLGLALAFRTSREGNIALDPETGAATAAGPGQTTMTFAPAPQQNYYRAVLGKTN